jgi:hypothetical protein
MSYELQAKKEAISIETASFKGSHQSINSQTYNLKKL